MLEGSKNTTSYDGLCDSIQASDAESALALLVP